MTEQKFTDEEVLEGLRLWAVAKCVNCAVMGSICCNSCVITEIKRAAETIKRQRAEIERLKKYYFTHNYHECHNEAIKEYLAKVLEKKDIAGHFEPMHGVVAVSVLEHYAKEFTEEND